MPDGQRTQEPACPYCPTGHTQLVLSWLEIEPAGHEAQLLDPANLVTVPSMQGEQGGAPLLLKWPGSQRQEPDIVCEELGGQETSSEDANSRREVTTHSPLASTVPVGQVQALKLVLPS